MTLMTEAAAAAMEPSNEPDARAADLWTGPIPLSWVRASPEVPAANLGDALSALIVGAIAGGVVRHANFNQAERRMIGIGTILQDQKGGELHVWGTGVDSRPAAQIAPDKVFAVAEGTSFHVHAVRGPRTAAVLRASGVHVPPVYGDPAWLLPKILPRRLFPAPTHDLGMIVHISELTSLDAAAQPQPNLKRYAIPEAMRGRVRLINTFCPPTLDGLIAKVGEILSCRRILSTSFHGLVIPLAYGTPALTFGFPGEGFRAVDTADASQLDHRFSDFLQGVGMRTTPAIYTARARPTEDWEELMRIVDRENVQPAWTGRDLFDAFPARKAVAFTDESWPIPTGFRNAFKF